MWRAWPAEAFGGADFTLGRARFVIAAKTDTKSAAIGIHKFDLLAPAKE
jgi:hypothetical protein